MTRFMGVFARNAAQKNVVSPIQNLGKTARKHGIIGAFAVINSRAYKRYNNHP